MLTNQTIKLIQRPQGRFTDEDVSIEQTEIDPTTLQEGEYLIENKYISIDPTQLGWASMVTYMPAVTLGDKMRCGGLGQVIASNNDEVQIGTWVTGLLGATKYIVTDGQTNVEYGVTVVKDEIITAVGGPEHYMPVLSLTGVPTGFVGMELITEDLEDKAGKTLVVSGASGNVGQFVVQLGKQHYGMRVIGIAGSDEKCAYLVDELGCDGAVNYKNDNYPTTLAELCPDGVDFYFDNVGGSITDNVFGIMNKFGRVAMCGMYGGFTAVHHILIKSLRVQGFLVPDRYDKIAESFGVALGLIAEGKLKWNVHPLQGIESFIHGQQLLRELKSEKHGKVYLEL